MKLCANLSFMFQEEEDLVARSVVILIFISDIMTTTRYRAAHQAGFSAVEVAHPYNEDMEALARVLKETGLKQVIRIPTCLFLAPTGALEMLIFVCLSGEKLSRAVNLHLSRLVINQST